MAIQTIKVPDIGSEDPVEVIEICVTVGDIIAEGDSIVVLETDKASMEIPADAAGKVVAVKVAIGDKVGQGHILIEIEAEGAAAEVAPAPAAQAAPEVAPAAAPAAAASEVSITVPDIGTSDAVEIIEISAKVGDDLAAGESILVLETDKASMEIPTEVAGKLLSLAVKVGDKVTSGAVIGTLAVEGAAQAAAPVAAAPAAAPAPAPAASVAAAAVAGEPEGDDEDEDNSDNSDVYAGPAVRKLARQLGVDLGKVSGSGPRGRLQKDDVRSYVKPIVQAVQSGGSAGGAGIPRVPAVDFAKFGEIDVVKMSKIKKITADNMSRNWLNVPHVTQWDDADITDLEEFRKALKAEAEKRGSKLTPMPFIMKACAAALVAEPSFNVSISADGESIVHKKYVNIGMAVDTPNGLVVPVIRNVDKKGLWELADEINVIAKKARDGKLLPADMQGGCFTISSLGAVGGNGFTPIVNAPEVAILGVSRAQVKPVWNGKEFIPRNMLPLSLSYDHRAINGGDAGRFFTYLTGVIADVRRLLL